MLCYNACVTALILATGRGCSWLEKLLSLIIAVVADVISYLICKRLDGDE